MFRNARRLRNQGWTLAEILVAMAVSSALTAGLVVGAITIQKSFLASRHHMNSQAQQMRLMDYINLDLRRALTVNTTSGRLTLTIPDYYDADGNPRDPRIYRGQALYGTGNQTIEYFHQGDRVFRKQGSVEAALASDVADFQLAFQDGGQSITVSVSFLPKFQFNGNRESVREGTVNFATTLLRNKRQY